MEPAETPLKVFKVENFVGSLFELAIHFAHHIRPNEQVIHIQPTVWNGRPGYSYMIQGTANDIPRQSSI